MRLNIDDVLPAGYCLHWYQLQSLLGDGGFGITYLGRDTNLNQSVAIKEYFPKSVVQRTGSHRVCPAPDADPQFFRWGLQRFLEEARLLARFRHPHIVRVLSVFEALGTAFMVMELERGESVADAIKSQSILTDAQVLDLCLPLLDGLELVHDAGFIHRDIKPDNILLRPAQGPVLIDFGSARQPHPGQSSELTAIVSRGYAPFEQYDAGNEQRQGPWSDIYGLAATLYHVMTGASAADALTRGMCLLNGDPDPLVPATVCAPGRFSSRLLGAVDRGLAFKAGDRPQSVSEWRELFPVHSTVRSLRPPVRTEALDKTSQREQVAARLKAARASTRDAASSAPDGGDTTLPNPDLSDAPYLHRRIVVVDDERSARTLTGRVLANLGATRVDLVEDGPGALACFADPQAIPALLICDLAMPGMDGVQLLRHLSERGVSMPLVLMADGDERLLGAARHLASAHGFTVLGTVRKPVAPDRLARVLARLDLAPAATSGVAAGAGAIDDDALRAAIAGGDIDLLYLPKVVVAEPELRGAEALVRWRGADGHGVDPGRLVQRVQVLGLADAFTELVLHKALAQAGAWRAAGLPCGVSVNVFAASLARLDLPELLVATADAEGVTPRDVTLEVNEVGLQAHRDVSLEVLVRLRLCGAGLSIDDFGTGSSSLERLRHIPFTEIKVDRSFVAAAVEERTSRVILESSVALARRLGLQVVAEGVADERSWELVSRLGFDTAQGYFIAPPLPGESLADWSRDWSLGRSAACAPALAVSA
jgi:EAL domain-containing protein (putative c-di-GMP-specific phosphodiesterase class I)/serine/threonine protein kinase